MKLFSVEDQNRLSEARKHSEERINKLAAMLTSGMVIESQGYDIGELIFAESLKYEKLCIVEAISDQNFETIQKNFRSMLRAAGSLVKNFAGTDLADKMDVLRITGVEQLNDLYEDIKDLEMGVSNPVKSKKASQDRDNFAKTFAEFAVLMKGAMSLGDLFSDDPASLGGYTAMKEIVSSLENDNLTSVPLKDAFEAYKYSVAGAEMRSALDNDFDKWAEQGDNIEWVTDVGGKEVPTTRADSSARPKHLKPKKKSFLSRLFGRREGVERGLPISEMAPPKTNMEKKFRKLIHDAIASKSPGFAKMVNVPSLIDKMMNKSYDHLAAIFGRFNDFVASDVDENFLFQTVKKPLAIGSMLKNAWDTFSSGTMGGPHGRSVG